MIYLTRVSLDIEDSNFKKNPRFKVAVESIQSLSSDENKTVILSHRGRPDPQNPDPALSLKEFVPALQKKLRRQITFLEHGDFKELREQIEESKPGSIFLLENLRFLEGEKKNTPQLGQQLASLGEQFINDDFPNSHREDASNVTITKFIASSMGPNMKRELQHLQSVTDNPKKPLVFIIGGAKINDKLGAVKHMLPKTDKVLLGGGPANTVLKARGKDVGESLVDESVPLGDLVQNSKVITPIDWRTEKNKILDIGPNTIKQYQEAIRDANTIIWNGPMGYIEKCRFAKGTSAIAKAIFANKTAQAVIGGGDTLSAIQVEQSRDNLLISMGGGAMLTFLAGDPLPAVEALKDN